MESAALELAPIVSGRRRFFCCHSATLSGEQAPNSLAAVVECVEAGVPRLEIDVRYMADDTMVIFHDSHFEPSTDGQGRVDELTYEDLKRIRYRNRPETPLCVLEDVVDAMSRSGALLQVDLKLMRPISAHQARRLETALAPLGDRVIVGSQAHWNLRALRGLPIAFDPTLQWCYATDDPPLIPRSLGVHGLWDDSPMAGNARFSAEEYIEQRILDIRGLLPNAVEWMVDIPTVIRLAELGTPLGERLRQEGCALAAWTLRRSQTDLPGTVKRLFTLGVETIITDVPLVAQKPSDGRFRNRRVNRHR